MYNKREINHLFKKQNKMENIEWQEDVNYKVIKSADEYGQVNVFIDETKYNKGLTFVGSYDINPYKTTDEIIESFGNYIGQVITSGCNYIREYIRRDANNIYIY